MGADYRTHIVRIGKDLTANLQLYFAMDPLPAPILMII